MDVLLQGVRSGRIIHAKKAGFDMYWFPKFDFSRDNLYKKGLQGETSKGSDDIQHLADVEEGQFQFKWEAEDVVSQGLGLPMSSPTASLPTSSPGPSPLMNGALSMPTSSTGSSPFMALQNMVAAGDKGHKLKNLGLSIYHFKLLQLKTNLGKARGRAGHSKLECGNFPACNP